MLTSNVRAMLLVAFAAALMFTHTACQKSSERSPVDEVAQNVTKDVAVVGQTSWVSSGAPVFVLEETHNSRASLVEHAIVLIRLYAQYGMRDIALEGYLQDGSRVNASWFTDRPGTSAVDRARVAVRLLKEGEIFRTRVQQARLRGCGSHPSRDQLSIQCHHERGGVRCGRGTCAKD